jgi:hypothetical protein
LLSLRLSFFARSLEDLDVLMIFEQKITSSKTFFLNGFNILAVDTYSGMELCMPTWLNHDYGDGGIVDILVVTHILEWSYACQYFWVRLASNVGSKSFLKKSSKLK